jgi:NAD+ kinase
MEIIVVGKRRIPKEGSLRALKCDDVCVAVGGDGTFIRAVQATDKPVLLIRDGHEGSMGYYSDVSLKDMDYVIKKLKSNEYHVEHLANKIEITYSGRHYFAVNEARLNNIMQEVSFKIYEKNGNKRSRVYPFIMSGDGMIITSKIGSTAYNRSAGGPIILASNVLCLTFLNPDGPYSNPIVIDGTKELEIEIVKYEGILAYDFSRIAKLKAGDRFTVRMSNRKINIVRLYEMSESLADKLERKIRSRMVKEFKD